MTIYGYARVSTKEQNLTRQITALKEAGCEVIFREKITGTKKDRPELNQLMEQLEEGDQVIVKDLTRISRSTQDLISLMNTFTEMGVGFKSIYDSWLDTTKGDTAMNKLLFTIFAGLSEYERDLISERTREGLAVARSKDKQLGRPSTKKEKVEHAIKLWQEGIYNIKDIVEITDVSKSTLYRNLKERGLK